MACMPCTAGTSHAVGDVDSGIGIAATRRQRTPERGRPSHRCSSVSEDTIVHSQMPGFTQGIARMTGNNEAFRRVRHRRKVQPMAQWPAPDPQDWQPPAPASLPAPSEESWTPPTWEELVRDHGARVYRLAYRLTGNPHDAEDLTQDVFVRVFRSLHRFQPGTFEGWLHRITTNLFLDGARRRQKIRFDGLGEGSAERLPSAWPNPSDQLADADLDHDVAAALSALSPEFRAAVVLCDIEGLSYEEISEVLDIKIGTVRSRIHRGRAQLRTALAHRRPTGERMRYLGVEVEAGGTSDNVSPKPGSLEPARSA
ncbi:MAG: polymerase subfamily sigma factor [Propionibacteriaceae bacterium]|nr:polymerase subfamily sigma factor [Propionibacteriaceae bacterium]